MEDAAKGLASVEPDGKETDRKKYDRLKSHLVKLSNEEGDDYRRLLESSLDPNKVMLKSLARPYFNLMKNTSEMSLEDTEKYQKIFQE